MDWVQIVLGVLGTVGSVLLVNYIKWVLVKFKISVESIWAMVITFAVCLIATVAILLTSKTIPFTWQAITTYWLAIVGAATGVYKVIWPLIKTAVLTIEKAKTK